jgi:integrase
MPVTLTDRVVQQAKAKSARVEIADAVLPGLYLVVQPTGAKSWAVRYRVGPRTRKLTLPGRYPVLSLAKAREAARLALESVTAGDDPAAAKHAGTPADDTLAAYVALYREKHVSGLRPGTAANTNRELEHMQDAWPGRTLRSISKKDVVAVIDKAMKRGPSAGVMAWKVAKAFFAWCEAREDDFASPARSVRKPAKEKSRDRVLDDAELRLTWEAADRAGGAAGALVKLLILTGARRNEITELARDEIKAEAIELPGERTKNGSPHTIPLTPLIRRVLKDLPRTGKFVLNGEDRPFGDHSGAKEKITPAIRPWTLHDLRRSFASGLQRLGVAPHIVELALNHRSGTFSGVAGIYQRHRYAKEVRDAFEMWSQHIETLTTLSRLAGDVTSFRNQASAVSKIRAVF